MMRRFFLLLFFLLSYQIFWSQSRTVTLRGKVFCENQPAPGAQVDLQPGAYRSTTDMRGNFVLRIPAGTYLLHVRYYQCHEEQKLHINRDTTVYVYLQQPLSETLETVVITAGTAGQDQPVSQTTVTSRQLAQKDMSKDVPYLLDEVPSVVSFSDAGNGTGYTGLRIRGISPQQINVNINGIPLNDPESQSVYWVDVPDLVASTSRIQVQRGVGLSQFGTGAFGANINLQTESLSAQPQAYAGVSMGSYNTRRLSAKLQTGNLRKHWAFGARFSQLHSDGYIDRAFADLQSYYFAAQYRGGKHRLRLIHFGGHERTYQAWYGVDWETFRTDPTFNYAGAIYDENGRIIDFYDNEVDDYTQKHYQLHYAYSPAQGQTFKLALHYTKGYGYYEQYKQDQPFDRYGFKPVVMGNDTVNRTDLIRRKWLDNDFYGAIATWHIRHNDSQWILGAAANRYVGDHFGRVIWARFADDTEKGHIYYFNRGIKTEWNGFIRTQKQLNDRWSLFSDMQVRQVNYRADYDPQRTYDPDEQFAVSDHLTFFNPKAGVTYRPDDNRQFYAFLAQTHREPNRIDYKENAHKPKPETLFDAETGYRLHRDNWKAELTAYWMYYRDQLVYTGKLNEVGYPIRENVGRSYRTGLELLMGWRKGPWQLTATGTISRNRNIDYVAWENGRPVHYGNTVISYSPPVVAMFKAAYRFAPQWQLTATAKYVGRQYMDNRNIPSSILPAYHVENLHLSWKPEWDENKPEILLKLNIYNIFAVKYAANGYMWGDDAYVFPQAPRHYSLTLDVRF